MLDADGCDAGVTGFAGLGESVVARVEVLALLELVLEEIFFVRKLAIEAEETLFIRAHGADVDLVPLVGIHSVASLWLIQKCLA